MSCEVCVYISQSVSKEFDRGFLDPRPQCALWRVCIWRSSGCCRAHEGCHRSECLHCVVTVFVVGSTGALEGERWYVLP